MSNPTSNFGWQMPTPTDLVTDLPADFEVFGQAVDSDFADLLGGTTGQVLSKTSNTDLDFTWVAANPGDITGVTAGTGISGGGTSGTVTVTNDMATTITASGDIVIGTGSGTYDNLPIGTTGQILTCDTTVSPYKVKWASPAGGGGMTQLGSTTTLSGTTTTISSISSSYKHLLIIIDRVTSSGSGSYNNISITPNSLTTSTTLTYGQYSYSGESLQSIIPTTFTNNTFEAAGEQSYAIWIYNYASTNLFKPVFLTGHMKNTSIPTPFPMGVMAGGAIASTNAINALTFTTTQSNTNGGSIILYGVS